MSVHAPRRQDQGFKTFLPPQERNAFLVGQRHRHLKEYWTQKVDIYCILSMATHAHQWSICTNCDLKDLSNLTINMSLIGLLQELRPEIISSRAKIERARIAENSKTILGFIDDFELLVQSSRLRNKLKLFIFLMMCLRITQLLESYLQKIVEQLHEYPTKPWIMFIHGWECRELGEYNNVYSWMSQRTTVRVRSISGGANYRTHVYPLYYTLAHLAVDAPRRWNQKPSDFMQKRRNAFKCLA